MAVILAGTVGLLAGLLLGTAFSTQTVAVKVCGMPGGPSCQVYTPGYGAQAIPAYTFPAQVIRGPFGPTPSRREPAGILG